MQQLYAQRRMQAHTSPAMKSLCVFMRNACTFEAPPSTVCNSAFLLGSIALSIVDSPVLAGSPSTRRTGTNGRNFVAACRTRAVVSGEEIASIVPEIVRARDTSEHTPRPRLARAPGSARYDAICNEQEQKQSPNLVIRRSEKTEGICKCFNFLRRVESEILWQLEIFLHIIVNLKCEKWTLSAYKFAEGGCLKELYNTQVMTLLHR